MKVCDQNGNRCARRQRVDKDKCKIPCEGIFADIRKEELDIIDETTPGMEKILIAYENYKNQFIKKTINSPGSLHHQSTILLILL